MEKRQIELRNNKTRSVVGKCVCPYCEEEMMLSTLPYCRRCTVTLHYCVTCKVAVPREAETCPGCGGRLL